MASNVIINVRGQKFTKGFYQSRLKVRGKEAQAMGSKQFLIKIILKKGLFFFKKQLGLEIRTQKNLSYPQIYVIRLFVFSPRTYIYLESTMVSIYVLVKASENCSVLTIMAVGYRVHICRHYTNSIRYILFKKYKYNNLSYII